MINILCVGRIQVVLVEKKVCIQLVASLVYLAYGPFRMGIACFLSNDPFCKFRYGSCLGCEQGNELISPPPSRLAVMERMGTQFMYLLPRLQIH